MSQFSLKSLATPLSIAGFALLGATVYLDGAIAAPPSLHRATESQNLFRQGDLNSPISQEFAPLDRVNSVSDLSDVNPNDWAFQALQSLGERYQCLLAYPDGSYRGDRALTRYEFAAGLNTCLDRIQVLIEENISALSPEDLAQLRRLQEEFAAELATLRGRVDALEVRTAELEANQFSTTTKLVGEAIFNLADSFSENDESQFAFSQRVRLNFVTSFSGKDSLITRLEFGNIGNSFADEIGTNEGRYAYDGAGDNVVRLNRLHYNFPIADNLKASIFANAGGHHFYAPTLNPYLEAGGGGTGALSRFGERNPIFRTTLGGVGVGFQYKAGNLLEVNAGYLSNEGNTPQRSQGLFDGNYSALTQVIFGDRFKIGLTYIHGYDGTSNPRFGFGGTGTALGTLNPSALGLRATPVVSNSYGVQTSLRISPQLILGGWLGKTSARLIGLGDADIWNYAVTLALPDLGKQGSLGGLIFGAEPYLSDLDVPGNPDFPTDIPFHVEGFYKYQMSDNIAITPGLIWLTSPNQNKDNDDVFIGTVRTTFSF
jgi:hypothetical protein